MAILARDYFKVGRNLILIKTRRLNKEHIAISMTEKGDPYENALAERVNGILKSEFGLSGKFDSFQQASARVDYVINIYNNLRPHSSINYLTPEQAHLQHGQIPARWKPRKQRVRESLYIELSE